MSSYKTNRDNTGNKYDGNHESVIVSPDVEYISTISDIICGWEQLF